MADLKKNGLWDDIQSGSENVADKMLGPSADYISMIQVPAQKGVGQNGDVGQLMTNASAVGDYIQQLITGPLQGNAQFVETGGMCKAPGGKVIPRWSYVNNRSSGSDVMPAKIQQAVGGGVLDGIIPGMFGDLADLNPLTLMNGLYLDGVPDCQAVVCPVTLADGTPAGNDAKFVTYGLEENMKPCVGADAATANALEDKEGFAGMFAPAPFTYGPAYMVQKAGNTELLMFGIASVSLVLILLHYNGGR